MDIHRTSQLKTSGLALNIHHWNPNQSEWLFVYENVLSVRLLTPCQAWVHQSITSFRTKPLQGSMITNDAPPSVSSPSDRDEVE
ncbi:hypothetical protein DAPPUDRAFT_249641 [Daphnia pulex]|uniref:Uncharacterized protein n=1 Tax=Daphnia pulex TaxID=6669 RepID=E9GX26_DAPPU|nr:hypothetical protein DAPPUDRAFT_249641 [Daphnia pulex]|eukprot:EFX76000.1 hypothetical protein DAPPUDRAFT_249641 [Daphnia pulex]